MFLKFKSDEERINYGGSYFIEIQYCKYPEETPLEKLVSVDLINNFNVSSLYIYGDDDNEFFNQYKDIFNDGVYSNLECGIVDNYGINYYNQDKITAIIEKLQTQKPKDYKILLEWLKSSTNGIYILGY